MVDFATADELRGYLEALGPAFPAYAPRLWNSGATSFSDLADASRETLRKAGVENDFHADRIRKWAAKGPGPSGEGGTSGATLGAQIEAVEARIQAKVEANIQAKVEEASNAAVASLRQALDHVTLKLNKASQTTRTYATIGEEVRSQPATEPVQLNELVSLAEGDASVVDACRAVEAAFPEKEAKGAIFAPKPVPRPKPGKRSRGAAAAAATEEGEGEGGDGADEELGAELVNWSAQLPGARLPGISLTDLAAPESTQSGFKEEEHMQPVLIKVLQAVSKAVQSEIFLMDTHRSPQLSHPTARPDCTGLAAAAGMPAWAQVVITLEFKLRATATEWNTMTGQGLQRSAAALDAQPGRSHIMALGFSMNCIEAMRFSLGEGKLKMRTTGPLPFSISADSPGFQLLVRVLKTSNQQHGYQRQVLPDLPELGSFQLEDMQLLRRGSAPGRSSFVYSVKATERGSSAPPQPAVLKLNLSTTEGDLLRQLQGSPHVIQLVERGSCVFQGVQWQAILIQPFVKHLTPHDPLARVAQVTDDVATGIEASSQLGIYQRDITPGNMGYDDNGRGYVLDYSAGQRRKVGEVEEVAVRSRPDEITGTMRYVPYSVLCGGPHTVSSQLEGLFMSVACISSDGRLVRHHTSNESAEDWKRTRLAQFGAELDLSCVAEQMRPLVRRLHDLFWAPTPRVRVYKEDVTAESVREACREVLAAAAAGEA